MEQLLLPAATDRSRSATNAFGPDWAAGAPWMALDPTHRQHWRDRQQAQAQDLILGGFPEPVQDDSLDSSGPRGPASALAACLVQATRHGPGQVT